MRIGSGMMITLLLVSIPALVLNVHFAKAGPGTWTVDDDGPADFPTIQEAINASNPGDTILVAPGTYYENVLVDKDGITLYGSGSNVTIIDGQSKYTVVYAYNVTSFIIEGFTIRRSGRGGSPGNGGVHIDPSYRWGGNFSIRRNKIQDNGAGIQVWNHAEGTVVIENNIISDNDDVGLEAESIGSGQVIIRSNTIAYNGADGYFDWAGAGYRSLINNIIVSNRFGIHSHVDTAKIVMYNDVWNNSEGNYVHGMYSDITPFTPSPGTGEISTNPLLDADNSSYRLTKSSPCIDAGTNENASSTDIEGNPRPIDGNRDGIAVTDMGAYEYLPPPHFVIPEAHFGALAVLTAMVAAFMVFKLKRPRYIDAVDRSDLQRSWFHCYSL